FARDAVREREARVTGLLRVAAGGAAGSPARDRWGFAASYWGSGWVVQTALQVVLVVFTVAYAAWIGVEPLLGNAVWMLVAVETASMAISVFLHLTSDARFSALHLIFSFTIPFYGLPMVMYLMMMAYADNDDDDDDAYGAFMPPDAGYYFRWENGMMAPLLGIIAQGVISGLLLGLSEVFHGAGIRVFKPPSADQPGPRVDASDDEDVRAEKERVAAVWIDGAPAPDSYGIVLKGVRKSFLVSATGRRSGGDSPASDTESASETTAVTAAVTTSSPGPLGLWDWRVAVDDVSVGVRHGEVVTLLGPNGAGKTTTLSMALGDIAPDEGAAFAGGSGDGGVGYCPQQEAVWARLTVSEHLWVYARVRGLKRAAARRWVTHAAGRLDLDEHLSKPVSDVSGGTRRKLAFAVATVGRVGVLFLDEPSTGIDPAGRRRMREFLRRRQPGCATLLTTHSMEDAEALSTRVGIMLGGRLACLGPPALLRRRHGGGYVLEVRGNFGGGSRATSAADGVVTDDAVDARWVHSVLPGAVRRETFAGVASRWEVSGEEVAASGGVGAAFARLEAARTAAAAAAASDGKDAPTIADYGLGRATLETVFLRFAGAVVGAE
ncbi:ATP-binding cassette sub- A member 5, partial [Cladochytrium tenue]